MTHVADVSRRSPYQTSIASYWDNERNAVNLALGDVDGYYHHHYGIGEADFSVLDGDRTADVKEGVTAELHRLEHAQANLLADHLGDLTPNDRVLDAGCGRGGGSFVANARFGCQVDGITLSQRQADFANEQAERRDLSGRVRFHVANMLDTGFPKGAFQAIWNNESTMYVDLDDLFQEHARQLATGGRYVVITGCSNDVYGLPSRSVSTIDAHYECRVHPRSKYFQAMARNRLVPIRVIDLTAAALPYWNLRKQSHLATGIEDSFIDAYTSGAFQYLLIAADRR